MNYTSANLQDAVLRDFFRKGTRVCTLPRRNSPRLFFSDGSPLDRWHQASFYRAFSFKAKCFRAVLRVLSACGFCQKTEGRDTANSYENFMRNCGLPETRPAVMIGTPGPHQKAIAQVWTGQKVSAYLKYAVAPEAIGRVQSESRLLRNIPAGLGPVLMGAGPFGAGVAVLMSPLPGRAGTMTADVPAGVIRFLHRLESTDEFFFADHPWIKRMVEAGQIHVEHYPQLSRRCWKTVIMHGDFTPWNLACDGEEYKAVDWESGCLQGFPAVDLAHYCIQSGLNLGHWSARKTAFRTVEELTRMYDGITQEAACELLRVCVQWISFRDRLNLEEPNSRVNWYKEVISEAMHKGSYE